MLRCIKLGHNSVSTLVDCLLFALQTDYSFFIMQKRMEWKGFFFHKTPKLCEYISLSSYHGELQFNVPAAISPCTAMELGGRR